MSLGLLQGQSNSVEVDRFETPSGARLRVREVSSGTEIYLDPIELEGLTRLRANNPPWSRDFGSDPSEPAGLVASQLEVLQNEFAMVEVGRLDTESGPRLFIRDLSSQAKAWLGPEELHRLTRLRHRDFGPLLDPSDLVAAIEPDPDQV
jgi:hypothetical protein